ncbi:hypothetical protein FVEN_g12907 [Fusarium venenatum]|nr:hypothetical protein FVEN_g12907 [Fusarium venenatum]
MPASIIIGKNNLPDKLQTKATKTAINRYKNAE